MSDVSVSDMSHAKIIPSLLIYRTGALRLLALRGWQTLLTLINSKVDNIYKYVCLTVIIDITRKITKFVNFSLFDG